MNPDAGLSQSVRELFDDKAAAWSRGYADGGALHKRVGLFADAVAAVVPAPARALDFGCGTGHIANALAGRGYEVDACDMSEAMLAEGRRLFGERVVFSLLPPDWTALPFGTGAFDVALASSVLEYVPDPDRVLGELGRVVRADGVLTLTVPDMRHPKRWLEQVLATSLAFLPGLLPLVGRVPRLALYTRFLQTSRNRFSEREWIARFARAGWSVHSATAASSPMLRLFTLRRRAAGG
jgi:ubiquinone/menaquinone biosynthesis C-methylase UbiE